MPDNLAIVIPAYKDTYLSKTLAALSRQTNKNFTVYIGDDASPYSLGEIVNEYKQSLNVIYHRFDTNLGGTNLVGQWERCLQMIQEEEYFCLFSDDDLMEPACIERFYEALQQNSNFDVFHFDIDIIDSNDTIIKSCNNYPPVLSVEDFLRLLYTYQIDARMPEFIFKTQHFRLSGGFVHFDLAYRSDNATVMVNAENQGIFTISGAKVLWRDSGINISSSRNKELMTRRVYATIDFFNWMEKHYRRSSQAVCPFSLEERLQLIISDILTLTDIVPRKELYKALKKINKARKNYLLYLRCKLYIMITLRKSRKHKKYFLYIKEHCLTPYSRR